jgi:hypothetical protein
MAHLRCTACGIRASGGAAQSCPGCGGPLESVARAADLIGFRAARGRPDATWSLADQVRATIARNDAARARRLERAHHPPAEPSE